MHNSHSPIETHCNAFLLKNIYDILYDSFGPQKWWPADSKFEVIIGAILTQNTNWNNVEKAIVNLKIQIKLTPKNLHELSLKKIEKLIKPSGFFKQKSERLYIFCEHLRDNYSYSLKKMFDKSLIDLRKELLAIKGIGPETADSIILYAAEKPIFVIDAYTYRLVNRLGFDIERKYETLQNFFHENIKADVELFSEYHALIVKLAKEYCRKKPLCEFCILKSLCKEGQRNV
ncbi:endonuclease III domain-containing protein [bacterium]